MPSSTSFTFDGDTLDYCTGDYNSARLNERAVEIPLAVRFATRYGIDLEVGNVLGHYGYVGHRVVDRYEGPEKLDVFDLTGPAGPIVSISTVEHVRHDEEDKDPAGAQRAIEHLRYLTDHLFITVGLGQHPDLDEYLMGGAGAECSTLVRSGDGWVQTPDLVWKPYGASTAWAESVWIGEWH